MTRLFHINTQIYVFTHSSKCMLLTQRGNDHFMNLLYPEIEGLLNLLSRALEIKLRRVILVGCFSSVVGGSYKEEYNETHWANPDRCDIEERVRFFVEKTAWFFVKEHCKDFDFTVFLPGLMLGPVDKKSEKSESVRFLQKLAENTSQKLLQVMLGTVDARDVSKIVVDSIDNKETVNGRYILVENVYWIKDLFKVIHKENREPIVHNPGIISKFILRFLSLFDSSSDKILDFHGKEFKIDQEKFKKDFRHKYYKLDQSVTDTLDSLGKFDRLPHSFVQL